MRTIEVKIADKKYKAALLFYSEYRQVASIAVEVLAATAEGNQKLIVEAGARQSEIHLKVLAASMQRAAEKMTPEELSDIAVPYEVVRAVNALMIASCEPEPTQTPAKVN